MTLLKLVNKKKVVRDSISLGLCQTFLVGAMMLY